MKERRQYPRYTANLATRYLYNRGMISLDEETTIIDISRGGASLNLSDKIKKGDMVLLNMDIPSIGAISSMLKIVWTIGKQAGGFFDWVSDTDKLTRYIGQLNN